MYEKPGLKQQLVDIIGYICLFYQNVCTMRNFLPRRNASLYSSQVQYRVVLPDSSTNLIFITSKQCSLSI